MENKLIHIGLDVGSTTVKVVVMDDKLNTIHTSYKRHFSDIRNTIYQSLQELIQKFPEAVMTIALTGSRSTINIGVFRYNIYSGSCLL